MTTKYYRTPVEEVYTSRDDEISRRRGCMGTVKSVTKMQTDYMRHYKPIPNDNNKADMLSVIEAEQSDAYIEQSRKWMRQT